MTEENIHHPEPSYLEYRGKYKGLLGWLTTTDHKRIGLMYMYAMMVFFIVGVILGEIMRLELFRPGQQFSDPRYTMGCLPSMGSS